MKCYSLTASASASRRASASSALMSDKTSLETNTWSSLKKRSCASPESSLADKNAPHFALSRIRFFPSVPIQVEMAGSLTDLNSIFPVSGAESLESLDRKSTRLKSSHTDIYSLSLHDGSSDLN